MHAPYLGSVDVEMLPKPPVETAQLRSNYNGRLDGQQRSDRLTDIVVDLNTLDTSACGPVTEIVHLIPCLHRHK